MEMLPNQLFPFPPVRNMNAPTVETIAGPKSTEGYENMLRELISFFLREPHRDGSGFAALQSKSSDLFRAMEDPPFGVIWFYSAVSCHNFKVISKDDPSMKLQIPDVFQILSSCSTQCNAFKKIALLAPVIYVVNSSGIDVWTTDIFLDSQNRLIERVIDYVSECCSFDDQDNGLEELPLYFVDLVRVWTMDQIGDGCKLVDQMSLLREFFPLLCNEVLLKINVGCRMDYLAGVVMNELFLLRLQLKICFANWKGNLLRELSDWAVQTIKKFQNIFFFGELLNFIMLDGQ